jgi:hypothetical protein
MGDGATRLGAAPLNRFQQLNHGIATAPYAPIPATRETSKAGMRQILANTCRRSWLFMGGAVDNGVHVVVDECHCTASRSVRRAGSRGRVAEVKLRGVFELIASVVVESGRPNTTITV